MIEVGDIAFLRLFWLAALPAIAVLWLVSARRAGSLGGWDQAIDPALMAALERLGRVVSGTARRNWLPAATAVLVAIALTGPARESRDGTTYRNLDGLVLVIDLSRSVAQGGYLTEALTAARLLAERAGSRPVALVVYAGDAYLASAFTTDADALGTTIAVLDGETVPDPGSRPERALAIARRTLSETGVLAGDVVLIADGGGLGSAALGAAEAIAAAGSRVSTLHVSGARRASLPSPGAAAAAGTEAVSSGAPEDGRKALEALARLGGGVAGDVLDPLGVADAVGQRPATRLAAGDYAVLFWTDYGRAILVLALFPALAMFRRRP